MSSTPRLATIAIFALPLGAALGQNAGSVSPAGSPTRQPPPGLILAAKVEGTVTLSGSGRVQPLKSNDSVSEGGSVATAASSTAVLVFSNGTTLQVEPNTELRIGSFRQEPFASTVNIGSLTVEPTASETRLFLERGGAVFKLKTRADSPFVVQSPFGDVKASAGVFRICIDLEPDRIVKFSVASVSATLSLAQGKNAPFQILPGREITVRITTPSGGIVRAVEGAPSRP